MGLTKKSMGKDILGDNFKIVKEGKEDKVVALAGNPNVGKSTVFNGLTGLNQHTGNWPGKTITNAQGNYKHKDKNFVIVDIPGTYSLMANSAEEEVARDFICFGDPDITVVVVDATCLERNLNLVLQTIEITNKVVVCVNLLDEAKKKKIYINLDKLASELGVPVVGTSAREGKGLKDLMDIVYNVTENKISTNPIKIKYEDKIEKAISKVENSITPLLKGKLKSRWVALKLLEGDVKLIDSIDKYLEIDLMKNGDIDNSLKEAKEFLKENNFKQDELRDKLVSTIVRIGENISEKVINKKNKNYNNLDIKIDKILTSKALGIPIMLLLLGVVFWITIVGANYPSQMLAELLFSLEDKFAIFFNYINAPEWMYSLLVTGMYRTLAWVVAVMLPPMAIFFPLFTILEDLGYLPRVAFNMDNFFKKSCACGKQALTMCMGFGCNAAGIIGCRIIDSPRERLIAIITNNFVPCNGRFPTLIAIITMFFAGVVMGPFKSVISTLMLLGVIVLGIIMTLLVSKILSKTILKGVPSSFTLELPPYRKPKIGSVIVRSIFDRTLFVLGRAVSVAIPAGIVIWIMANIKMGNLSILDHCAKFLQPFAHLIGLDGYILMAFILGFPANEIVLPIIIMSYMASGSLIEFDNLVKLKTLLLDHGWTWLTALCTMVFSLMHWPCSTTCLTIKKETQSFKWTLVSFLVPTICGIVICFIIASVARLIGLA
ncbi:ferrous iron transport protein B [Clostridium collagenovorans DSM 3089]|uniref:Ferrous iron transport protein B n=1 Tax=Clostridium collagenovorans DSM 3089 TaxID=1121306 RepID=A0A1M5SKC0_9CLOT|nr:ferrous iron transport protein B [Clostridium collagenovorans]SHH39047.1 ferrous iron transport protein B [Clostridium collagenovorans DSM 3089]